MIEPQLVELRNPRAEVDSRTEAGHLFAGSLAVAILALYMGFIFNRYLPINEGWFHYYAWLMHKGQMPYRDFWFFGQPVTLGIAWLFGGDHLINLRIFGLVERIVLSGMLYFLLSRQFSPRACFLATLVSMAVFLSYVTEGFFTYLVDALVLLVGALICVYEAQIHPRWYKLILILAGILTSLSFLAKQSVGAFNTLAVVILIAWPPSSVTRRLLSLLYFSIGWCAGAVPIVSWLVKNGAWHSYVTEVFTGAAASKGSLTTVFLGTLQRSITPSIVLIFAIVIAIIALAVWKQWLIFRRPESLGWTKAQLSLTALLALVMFFTPIFWRIVNPNVLRVYISIVVRVVFLGMVLQFAWIIIRRFLPQTEPVKPMTLIFLLTGILWAYGCALSFKVEQHSIIFLLAYLVAVACDNLSSRSGQSLIGILAAVCLLQLGESALYKYNDAYDWNGWRSVITIKSRTSHWPQLAGFRPDPATVYMVDSILDDIVRGSRPGEPIFTFPSIPMFNFITGRPQPTFAPVHYWDVCPDDLAERDAARVLAAKPAVIVDMELPEWIWDVNELGFRRGKKSGQRKIEAVIQELASSGDYRLMQALWTPWMHVRVNVWQRIK